MKFVLNDRVYKISHLSEIETALSIDIKTRYDVVSILYYMTKQALLQSIDIMLTLAINKNNEEYYPSLLEEIAEFRKFLSEVEKEHPTVFAHAKKIVNEAREGKLSLDGKDIFVIVETKYEVNTKTDSS